MSLEILIVFRPQRRKPWASPRRQSAWPALPHSGLPIALLNWNLTSPLKKRLWRVPHTLEHTSLGVSVTFSALLQLSLPCTCDPRSKPEYDTPPKCHFYFELGAPWKQQMGKKALWSSFLFLKVDETPLWKVSTLDQEERKILISREEGEAESNLCKKPW